MKHMTRTQRLSERRYKRLAVYWLLGSILLLVSALVGLSYADFRPVQNLMQPAKHALNMTGDLKATVIEDYPSGAPAKDIYFKLDGKAVKPDGAGHFIARDIPTGEHTLSVGGGAYEGTTKTIDIEKGLNKCTVKLCLTVVEATKRWMETKRQNKPADTYFFLHPDEKRRINKQDYIKFKLLAQKEYNIAIANYQVHAPRFVVNWKHPVTGKIYRLVAAMKVDAFTTANGSPPKKQSWDVYAQKVNGRWAFLASS